MPSLNQPLALDQTVVDQAAAVAAVAVRAVLSDALRQAAVCRCHHCRARAGQVTTWATSILEAGQPATGAYHWLSRG